MKPSQTLFFLSYEITDSKHSHLLLLVYFRKRKKGGFVFLLSQDFLSDWILFFTLTEKKTTLLRVLMLLVLAIRDSSCIKCWWNMDGQIIPKVVLLYMVYRVEFKHVKTMYIRLFCKVCSLIFRRLTRNPLNAWQAKKVPRKPGLRAQEDGQKSELLCLHHYHGSTKTTSYHFTVYIPIVNNQNIR